MKFIEQYPLDKIQPAPYNPRFISQESFDELKKSLKALGTIKPLIVNSNGNIIAGHQRCRALKEIGVRCAPVFESTTPIPVSAEISFNLMHNSLEADKSAVQIMCDEIPCDTYTEVPCAQILLKGEAYMNFVAEYCKLILKYGQCGSVVVSPSGEVVHNGEYAHACFLLNQPCLVYKLNPHTKTMFDEFMRRDYGVYDFSRINTHNYSQSYAQLNRKDGWLHSYLYSTRVEPNVKIGQRILDFGAGNGYSIRYLNRLGHTTYEYEPFRKKKGSKATIDTAAVKHMISTLAETVAKSGLFDVVICDHVLNSVKDDTFQDYVLKSLNAFVRQDGILYLATRGIGDETARRKAQSALDKRIMGKAQFRFLDHNGYHLSFLNNVWFKQKYYGAEELRVFISKYFSEVDIVDTGSIIYADCRQKKHIEREQLKIALDEELNMEYPRGVRLNCQHQLVEQLLLLNQ